MDKQGQPQMLVDSYKSSSQNSEKACLVILNGFPGLYTRNEDLAPWAVEKFQWDVFIPLYTGIGRAPGEFLFTKAINESISLIRSLRETEGYKKVHLIGHSWGGYVALSALANIPELNGNCALLSPLTFVPPMEFMKGMLEEFVAQQLACGKKTSVPSLSADLELLRTSFDILKPEALEAIARREITILHAIKDQVIRKETVENFATRFAGNIRLAYLDTDHWFSCRPDVRASIEQALS